MAETVKVGSSAWWGQQADKLVDIGLGALNTALTTAKTTPNVQSTPTGSIMPKGSVLPYVALGLVAVGIVVIIAKR